MHAKGKDLCRALLCIVIVFFCFFLSILGLYDLNIVTAGFIKHRSKSVYGMTLSHKYVP